MKLESLLYSVAAVALGVFGGLEVRRWYHQRGTSRDAEEITKLSRELRRLRNHLTAPAKQETASKQDAAPKDGGKQ